MASRYYYTDPAPIPRIPGPGDPNVLDVYRQNGGQVYVRVYNPIPGAGPVVSVIQIDPRVANDYERQWIIASAPRRQRETLDQLHTEAHRQLVLQLQTINRLISQVKQMRIQTTGRDAAPRDLLSIETDMAKFVRYADPVAKVTQPGATADPATLNDSEFTLDEMISQLIVVDHKSIVRYMADDERLTSILQTALRNSRIALREEQYTRSQLVNGGRVLGVQLPPLDATYPQPRVVINGFIQQYRPPQPQPQPRLGVVAGTVGTATANTTGVATGSTPSAAAAALTTTVTKPNVGLQLHTKLTEQLGLSLQTQKTVAPKNDDIKIKTVLEQNDIYTTQLKNINVFLDQFQSYVINPPTGVDISNLMSMTQMYNSTLVKIIQPLEVMLSILAQVCVSYVKSQARLGNNGASTFVIQCNDTADKVVDMQYEKFRTDLQTMVQTVLPFAGATTEISFNFNVVNEFLLKIQNMHMRSIQDCTAATKTAEDEKKRVAAAAASSGGTSTAVGGAGAIAPSEEQKLASQRQFDAAILKLNEVSDSINDNSMDFITMAQKSAADGKLVAGWIMPINTRSPERDASDLKLAKEAADAGSTWYNTNVAHELKSYRDWLVSTNQSAALTQDNVNDKLSKTLKLIDPSLRKVNYWNAYIVVLMDSRRYAEAKNAEPNINNQLALKLMNDRFARYKSEMCSDAERTISEIVNSYKFNFAINLRTIEDNFIQYAESLDKQSKSINEKLDEFKSLNDEFDKEILPALEMPEMQSDLLVLYTDFIEKKKIVDNVINGRVKDFLVSVDTKKQVYKPDDGTQTLDNSLVNQLEQALINVTVAYYTYRYPRHTAEIGAARILPNGQQRQWYHMYETLNDMAWKIHAENEKNRETDVSIQYAEEQKSAFITEFKSLILEISAIGPDFKLAQIPAETSAQHAYAVDQLGCSVWKFKTIETTQIISRLQEFEKWFRSTSPLTKEMVDAKITEFQTIAQKPIRDVAWYNSYVFTIVFMHNEYKRHIPESPEFDALVQHTINAEWKKFEDSLCKPTEELINLNSSDFFNSNMREMPGRIERYWKALNKLAKEHDDSFVVTNHMIENEFKPIQSKWESQLTTDLKDFTTGLDTLAAMSNTGCMKDFNMKLMVLRSEYKFHANPNTEYKAMQPFRKCLHDFQHLAYQLYIKLLLHLYTNLEQVIDIGLREESLQQPKFDFVSEMNTLEKVQLEWKQKELNAGVAEIERNKLAAALAERERVKSDGIKRLEAHARVLAREASAAAEIERSTAARAPIPPPINRQAAPVADVPKNGGGWFSGWFGGS